MSNGKQSLNFYQTEKRLNENEFEELYKKLEEIGKSNFSWKTTKRIYFNYCSPILTHLFITLSITIYFLYRYRPHVLHGLCLLALDMTNIDSFELNDYQTLSCGLDKPEAAFPLFVPPADDCDFCMIDEVPEIHDITQEEFLQKYAFTKHPVLIKNAAKHWKALQVFSVDYFVRLDNNLRYVIQKKQELDPSASDGYGQCQFFPYKTNFSNIYELGEALRYGEISLDGKTGKPWYVGWNNCHPSSAAVLRKYYQVPYFVPNNTESSTTDWIFIGCPGYGAHLHVDQVDHPSWQAQLKGEKIWTLMPPPECALKCKYRHDVHMFPGDIIVVDTNHWYHKTLIVGDEVSICIGSEYN
ncbi:hypothetical protein SNEBB_004629 [Seison nebaliae]|nr:hypothetical protein SNEBB_004629 [Seison nebaliae]